MRSVIVVILAATLAACQTAQMSSPYVGSKTPDYVRIEGVVHGKNEDEALSIAQGHCHTFGKTAVFAHYSRVTASSTYACR